MEGLKVVANLTLQDFVLSNGASLWLSPQNRYGLLGVCVVLPALMLNSFESYIRTVIGSLVIGATGTFVVIGLMARFNPNLNRGVLGRHEFEISETGFLERTEYNETTHGWGSIDIVAEMFGLLMIRVGGAHWHVIPIRHFSDAEHRETFKQQVRIRSKEWTRSK